MKNDHKARRIANIPAFSGLNNKSLRELARLLDELARPADVTLTTNLAKEPSLLIVAAGVVGLRVAGSSPQPVSLAAFGRGIESGFAHLKDRVEVVSMTPVQLYIASPQYVDAVLQWAPVLRSERVERIPFVARS